MKKLILPIFIALAFAACKKEDEMPSPTYHLNNDVFSTTPSGCIQTADGNLAFCAGTFNSLFIFKVTPTGSLVWQKQYTIQDGIFSSVIAIAEDDEQSLYATSTGQQGLFIFKANALGDSLWFNNYGNTFSETPNNIIYTSDGNILVLGTQFSTNFYMVKVNRHGGLVWENNYSFGSQVAANHLLETQQGQYILTGNNPQFNWLLYLKVAANGDLIWNEFNEINGLQTTANTIELNDGSLITCGSIFDNNTGDFQGYVLKASDMGTELWQRSYGTRNNIEVARCVVQIPNGNFMVAGTSSSQVSGRTDAHLITVSPTGDSLLFNYFASNQNILPTNIFKQPNMDNIIVGQISKTNGTNGVFITPTDASGRFK